MRVTPTGDEPSETLSGSGQPPAPRAHDDRLPPESGRQRRHRGLVLGVPARACLVVAGAMLVAAGYFLLSPVQLIGQSGVPFKCGSGLHPPKAAFGRNTCGSLPAHRRAESLAWAVAAFVVGAGGVTLFGSREI